MPRTLPASLSMDAEDGPTEMAEEDWDGTSLFVGKIPSVGVRGCGDSRIEQPVAPKSGAHRQRTSAAIFQKGGEWELSDGLRDYLEQFGDGLSKLHEPVVSRAPVGVFWALVSFQRRQDAEELLLSGLSGWILGDNGEPCEGGLLKRSLSAVQVRAELEQAEAFERRQLEKIEVAVARIYTWLDHNKQTLDQLFTNIDKDGSGDFDEAEFREGMMSIGLTFDDDTINAMFSHLDEDGGGCVDTAEFIASMQQFENLMGESASSVLVALCRHMETAKEDLKDIFARVDREVSLDGGDIESTVDISELHEALVAAKIPNSETTLRDIAAHLGMTVLNDAISLADLTESLGAYRRRRHHAATKALLQCSEYLRKTGHSAMRIFTKCSSDGSGKLDVPELKEAMRRMGQALSNDTVAELMAELDLDNDGSIHVNEFLDKARQASNQQAADAKRCKELFDQCDKDDSGCLDEQELVYVASAMGLAEQASNQNFVQQMMSEIQTLAPSGMENDRENQHATEVSYHDFLLWFNELGSSYMERPSYKPTVDLTAPSDEDLSVMFAEIDADGSGSVDFQEVQEALTKIWPYMDERGFRRAFHAADNDDSGAVECGEFVQLVKFTVWLNDNRHRIQELEDAFHSSGEVGWSEFHYGNTALSFGGSEGNSRYLYQKQCEKLGLNSDEDSLTFEQFVTWAVLHACVGTTHEETESEAQARRNAIMQTELANMAGEYGDLHFQDLASVVMRGGESQESELRRRFKGVVRNVIELSELVNSAFANSRARNDSFPLLPQAILRKITQMCYKEEYFSGQNIITQGENDGTYYILRRGRVDVILDDQRVGGLEYGNGFGEIGLLLGTRRTATITCVTPCEVYSLDRADYETLVAMLPKEQRTGPLANALQKFWGLMTNPHDGSRTEAVDYKTYLKSHIRTSKTLTANSDAEAFDEYEERAVAQSDWAEDCERYRLKVTDSLDKTTYFSSMYQLVELWSEDCHLSYETFLTWVLDNIASWNEEQQSYTFKSVKDVDAVGDKFEKLKEDARAAQAAEEEKEAAALATAEERRQQQAREAEARRQQEDVAVQKKKDALAKIRLMTATMKTLGGEYGQLQKKLSALDDEEAELLRRLASGELTPEEEAAVRARLAEIEAERKLLEVNLNENRLNTQIAELNRKLAALDDEEAELMRRLATGTLSPEEEKAIRQRLAEIAAERDMLLHQRAAKMAEQLKAAGDVRALELSSKLNAIDRNLEMLDTEEADLLRRLAAGHLTPEEEAAIRKRLAEIAAEREALLREKSATLAAEHAARAAQRKMQDAAEQAELKRKLAALDDEEAELRRKLAAGDLTPEEEEAIRKRLAEIEAERAELHAQLQKIQVQANIADIDERLAALADEKAELLRRLAAGNLTPEEEAALRRRLEEISVESQKLLEQQLSEMNNRLAALEDEEAELLRRLAAGDLSPEEEAAIRKRLSEIEAERKGLQRKVESQLAMSTADQLEVEVLELKRKLAALDDEEAELRRKLAAGDLTPEEEEAIRKRLAEIEAERAELHAQLYQAEVKSRQAQLADIDRKLAALDDEEAALLKKLAAGDLTAAEEESIRKRLAEIAAERETLLHMRTDTAKQLHESKNAATKAAGTAESLQASLRPETPVGPLGGKPIYTTPCPPADNPVWTPTVKSSWVYHARERGESRMMRIIRTRGGMNPLGQVAKRAKIVSCRHCLHGVCPACRRTMTDANHKTKRPPHHLGQNDGMILRETVRLARTKSASPIFQPNTDPESRSPSSKQSALQPVGRKLLPPLERERAIVLESRLSTRVYSRGPALLEH